MAAPDLVLWDVLSKSKRIINANPRHFLTLSLIFLFPISFSIIISPILFQLFYHSFANISHFQHQPINPNTIPLLFSLFCSFFLFIFSLSAVTSITYSVFQAFYGRPINVISAIKYIFTSFLHLHATLIISDVIIFSILFLLGLLLFLVAQGSELVGIRISFSWIHVVVLIALLFALVTYFKVTWTLVSVIVVVESTWGLKALRRSASLIKGMKGVVVSSFFFFGFVEGILIFSSLFFTMGSDAWRGWAFVLPSVVFNSTLVMLFMLHEIVANTVLYLHCKAIRGELDLEIAEEFGMEYVKLPLDDDKVPRVVSDVYM